MATKKTETKKSPTGAPLGNPLKFFREGGEKIKAMYKKGGYNTPLQRKDNGGGSGIGSMYAADQAFESMMNPPVSTPKPSKPVSSDPYGNTTPGKINPRSYSYKNTTPPDSVNVRDLVPPNLGPIEGGGFGDTNSGRITPLIRKKGGAIKRKKK